MSLFGMSSLDLFASALGAFILISIIIFPLIADTSRSDPAEPIPLLAAVSCPEPIVCPVCPAVTTPAPAPAPVVAAAPETPPAASEPVTCRVCPPIPDPVAVSRARPRPDAADGDLLSRMAPSFGIGLVAFGSAGDAGRLSRSDPGGHPTMPGHFQSIPATARAAAVMKNPLLSFWTPSPSPSLRRTNPETHENPETRYCCDDRLNLGCEPWSK